MMIHDLWSALVTIAQKYVQHQRLIEIAMGGVALPFIALASISHLTIMEETNSRLPSGRRFSSWTRSPFSLFLLLKMHRAIYPESKLRLLFAIGYSGLAILGLLALALEISWKSS